MKKIYKSILLASIGALFFIGCSNSLANVEPKSRALALDVKEVCDTSKNSINDVLALAILYNKEAIKEGLEFKRLGMKTSQYISAVQDAIKNSSNTIDIVNKKNKKTGSVSISYAAWRACSFSIRALQQKQEAKSTWRLAVPGDAYKY